MPKNTQQIVIAEEAVISKIYFIRGEKVMLDRDLAELYGVETKTLKQAVRRNINRFPPDFMFECPRKSWRIGGHNMLLPSKIGKVYGIRLSVLPNRELPCYPAS
jgi:hypothetical protein